MSNEWIQWNGGGARPVEANDVVKVKTRGGHESKDIGLAFSWSHCKSDSDIVAYKLANDASKPDQVNHPSHYTAGKVECIDALEAATVNLSGIEAVCTANAIKYLWRWKQKGGKQDLEKAKWYIDRLLTTAPDSAQ